MEGDGCKLGSAGSLWQDTLAIALTPSKPVSAGSQGSRGGNGRSRALSVVLVFTEDLTEPLPLRCLEDACREIPAAELTVLHFGTVALGDMGALDSFYNAGYTDGKPLLPPAVSPTQEGAAGELTLFTVDVGFKRPLPGLSFAWS
ncbi:UNVERIFIED_CONTAM: hypothetical protein K2H54_052509 [Gekko kuhli]